MLTPLRRDPREKASQNSPPAGGESARINFSDTLTPLRRGVGRKGGPMEPNETPMGPEELRPEPQKSKKKVLPYVVCCLATAVVVFALTFAGMTLLQSRQKSTSDDDYLAKVREVVALLDARYVDGLDHTKLGDELAAAAVSATGDRWSYYISADELAAYQEQNANAYVGIGVTIRLENEDDAGFTVASVTPGGPAEAAGLQIGDMLLAIDGANMKELGMEEARNRVRGEEGTSLTLTVQRGVETFDVTVTRATIEVEVVRAELLDGNVGYLKINNFDSGCAEKSIAAIESLREQGATSLLFDVRFNPGGHKDELVELLDYLLPEGPLFRSVDYKGNEDIDYSDAACVELPMAVLVNGDSYSAAEFFAAALQEYGVGTVVGTQTVGKANYQQTFVLSDGSAVAVSTGHYQTPHGVTLAGVGITPDIPVEVDDDTYLKIYSNALEKSEDAQLQAAIAALTQGNP